MHTTTQVTKQDGRVISSHRVKDWKYEVLKPKVKEVLPERVAEVRVLLCENRGMLMCCLIRSQHRRNRRKNLKSNKSLKKDLSVIGFAVSPVDSVGLLGGGVGQPE